MNVYNYIPNTLILVKYNTHTLEKVREYFYLCTVKN